MRTLFVALGLAVFVAASTASAHVVVSPNQINVAAFQTFTVGVPNEKDNPVTMVRLVLPTGLKEVSPTVKPGWTIETKKDGDTVTEIDWTGGSIPPEQRDDFTFSAQAPDAASTLVWKAYQSYQDGSTVSWDQEPSSTTDDAVGDNGPYSKTEVVDDLNGRTDSQTASLWISIVSLALAATAISFSLRRR